MVGGLGDATQEHCRMGILFALLAAIGGIAVFLFDAIFRLTRF